MNASDEEDGEDYQPPANKIILLYEKICKGEIPELEAVIHPRRAVEKKEVQLESQKSVKAERKSSDESMKKVTAPVEPNEFDFDSQPDKPLKTFKLKRTPVRPQQKKVARMDKVCSDILKYQKMDEDQLQQKNKKT